MTPTDSRRLKRCLPTKPTRLKFGLPPATSPRRSRKRDHGESVKRLKTVIEAGNEKRVRFGKPRSAQGAWKRNPPGVSTGFTLSCLAPKRRESPSTASLDLDPVLEMMAERYEMRWYPAQVDFSAIFKRSGKLAPTIRDEVPDSRRSALVSFLCSVSINKNHRANNFFTAEEMKFLRKVV